MTPLTTIEIDSRVTNVKSLADMEIINHRRNRARINGLNIKGDWVLEPVMIKNHIFNFFKTLFKEENCSNPTLLDNLFNRLNLEDMQYLDGPFSSLEIKEEVYDCGSDTASGPDGFTFKFIKKHRNLIEINIISYVKEFEASSFILRGCNSSFITHVPKVDDPLTIGDFKPISLIRCKYKIIVKVLANRLSKVISAVVGEVQIIDGPLMADEIISWERKQKRRLMLFKVDFDKASDSLSCLRQGALLSLFLFIISVEALNIAILEATNRNIFYGFKVGKEKVHISHLQFADDALFLGEWSLSNANNLSGILTCFHLASRLKVNLTRANYLELAFQIWRLTHLPLRLGVLPLIFLVLTWGFRLAPKCQNAQIGNLLLNGFKKDSLSGKRAHFHSVSVSLSYDAFLKISWIAWEKVLSPRNKGGIGIGRLSTSNHSLLAKWWWRFRTEEYALWCKMIRSIHGVSVGLIEGSNTNASSGPWSRIMKLKTDLNLIGIDLPMLFKKKVGNGQNIRIWHDNWLEGVPLHAFFPWLYQLESNSNSMLTISPNVEVSFFKLLCTTDDIEDMTFDVYALPCYGLVLFVMALIIHAL
ncbi:hypothetical protein Tco_1096776 [Tanacetum coccineum]